MTTQEERMLQRSRMKMLAILCIALFFILVARLWYLQIALGSSLLAESEINRTRLVRTRAPRGLILDRKGRVLATSRPQFVVLAVPEKLQEDPEALATLCNTLDLTGEELQAIISRERAAEFAPVRVAIDVPLDVVAKLMERRPILPGVSVELDQLRSYPDGPLAAHILGYIGEVNREQLEALREQGYNYRPGDYVGKSGIEKQYETLLHGKDGGQVLEVDARGRTRRILGNQPPVPGSTLTLTINKDLQIAANRMMEGKTGAAAAVNPQTGEVLAMVSKPDFDPNIFVKRVKASDWKKITGNKANPLQNRAVANKYPPGSTFKPVTATAALEYKVATPSTNLSCSGVGLFGKRCWRRHGHVTFTTAISQSCNVFFYEMGRRMGVNKLAKMARGYGLSYATGIDLPEEVSGPDQKRKGTIPDEQWKWERYHDKWYPGETPSVAIGQGYVQVTPLQMALVSAAVSTSGKMYRPQMVREIRDPRGKVIQRFERDFTRQVPASQETFDAVRYGMRQTVIGPGGTGRAVNLEGVAVAGKTGSAEDPPRHRPHAWFICYAPIDNPEIAIAVISEQGGHGSTGAAPVARAILDVYFGKKKPSEIKPAVVRVTGD
ncbi:MAG: penicillin-binding protein 2 [Armatimonadetes bacterium]|nr:penicillin-binding protein 2 [Armatimonadota bacterium]